MNKAIDRINNDEITLKELILRTRNWIKYLWSKKIIIVLCVISGGVIGLIYAKSKKPIFIAVTTFVLEESGGGSGLSQYAGMAAMVGVNLGGNGGGLFEGDNIVELYKSRAMLQKALLSNGYFDGKSQLLIDRYLEFNKLRETWKKKELKLLSFSDTANFGLLQDSVIGGIVNRIRNENLFVGKPDKKLSILKVEVKSKDEQFAKVFNEKIVSTVNQFYIDTKAKKSLDNVRILKRQTDSVRTVMSGAIYSSASTLDATPNLNPARQVLRASVKNSQFNAETNKLMLAELVKQLELANIMLRTDMPLIQIIDSPIYPLQYSVLGKTRSTLVGSIIAGCLIVLWLILRNLYLKIVDEK